jgi:hypothetical protein
MPQIFVHKGQQHMIIEPNTHMFNSSMICEVEARGGLFGVNLETGKFGVIPDFVVNKLKNEAYKPVTVVGSDGNEYRGTVDESGSLRFFIKGNWRVFNNIFEFLESFK